MAGWAEGLQGMGAWFSGQGPQYEAAKALESRTAADDERQRRLDKLAGNKLRVEALVTDFAQVKSLRDQGRNDLAIQLLNNRIPLIDQDPDGDSTDSRELLAAISDESRQAEADAELTALLTAAGKMPEAGTMGSPRKTSDGGMAVYDRATNTMIPVNTGGMNFNTPAPGGGDAQKGSTQVVMKDGQPYIAGSVFNPQTQQWSVQMVPFDSTGSGGVYEIPDASGLPPSLRADQKAREAEGKASGGGVGTRGQQIIDDGYTAASGLPTLYRAQQILNLVETGGVEKAKVAAKQYFGIETADEGELSNLLGTLVVQQLRPTFGAAFTAKEGDGFKEFPAGGGRWTNSTKRS